MSAYDGTKWELVRESLIIFRRLQEGPADRATLIQAVQAELPTSFQQPTAASRRRHFERVIAALRERLFVDVPWDRSLRMYVLRDFGPYLQQTLTPDQLQSLSILLDNFSKSGPRFQRLVQPVLEQIRNRLTPEQRRILERQYPVFQLEALNRPGGDHVEPAVFKLAEAAVTQHRLLRFDYFTPKHAQEDGLPITHTVEPYEILFRDGHTYLQAFCREWQHPNGKTGSGSWHPYRLDYVLKEQLTILPTVFPTTMRSQRLLLVRYKVAPRIGRGNVAQHFEEMQFMGEDKAGWLEIIGKTTSLFDAYRTLLRLGNLCVVLEPAELVGYMRDAAAGMVELYEQHHPIE